MLIIGITGPTGSGKSEVGKILQQYNIPTIDADKVYHQILIPPSACLDELVSHFGNEILNDDGSLNRNQLSKIVFTQNGKTSKKILNTITHKYVIDSIHETIKQMHDKNIPCAAIDAPLLIESNLHLECDIIIVVSAPTELRFERIINRDHLSREQAQSRINAQPSDDFYKKYADYFIINNQDFSTLYSKVISIISHLNIKDTKER